MTTRPRDDIRVSVEGREFTAFKSLELNHDLHEVASCVMSFGDDGSWPTVSTLLLPGREVKVACNGYLVFTGRVEAHTEPLESSSGMVIQVVARSKLSDARVASAKWFIFANVTLRQFLYKLFEQLGYGKKDFLLAAAVDRNLTTGRAQGQLTRPVDLDRPKFDQLKVQPPETVWECAERVLKRHHLMIWEAGDGRIVVGRPDDTQSPLYTFICRRYPNAAQNNVLAIRPSVDWSEVPSEVHVTANTYGHDVRRSPIQGVAVDLDLAAESARSGHFNRIVYIPNDGARTKGYAEAASRREMAARAKSKRVWETEADGWSQWQRGGPVNYVINTVADVQSDVHPGLGGAFLVQKVVQRLDLDRGPHTTLSLVAKGVYDI